MGQDTNFPVPYSLAGKRILVTGHNGMVGSAVVRRLASEPVAAVLTADRHEMDLTRQADVEKWMDENRPDAIIHAAGRVGGILANKTYPADFLYDNMIMGANVVNSAFKTGVEKLLFLGSSCIYPKHAPQPISEDALLTGPLESTNEAYAIAKIAGLKLCEFYREQYGADYISAMPTNLYGPGDNFDLENSHVIPALIRKAHDAKISGAPYMEIWGSGSPRREFLHVDDCADGCVFILKNVSRAKPVNLGSGTDITISELAQQVMEAVGFTGELRKDTSKPDGTPRKLMDSETLLSHGWRPSISLSKGLSDVYSSVFLEGGAARGL